VTRPIRWWPCLATILVAMGCLFWIWLVRDISRQEKNLQTLYTGVGAVVLLLIWLLFVSRIRWRIKLLVVGALLSLMIGAQVLLRVRGVTGDLLPVLEWRWKRPLPQDLAQPAEQGVSADSKTTASASAADLARTGNDYPQFLGPDRNAVLAAPRLARDWKTQPPEKIWRQPVGPAWSGFSIAGNRAVTQEQRGEKERVVCYDLLTGKLLWSHEDDAHYHTTIAGEGPRATPAIAGSRVVTVGATGILNCLELQTGKLIWSKNIIQENQAPLNDWGVSASPLIINGWVIVSAGGTKDRSLLAYEMEDGKFVWGGGNESASYSSPRLATLLGIPQLLIFNSANLTGHDLESGRVLWKYAWPKGHPHVAMPAILPDDRVLVSSGYGTGAELLQLGRNAQGDISATRIWKSIRLKSKFANIIVHNGFIYGLDDGTLVCLDATEGRLRWKEGRYGHGQMILVGSLLLLTAEDGNVVLIEPLPDEHRELSRFSALKGKTWNVPALAGGYLVVRNDQEGACYRLPIEK